MEPGQNRNLALVENLTAPKILYKKCHKNKFHECKLMLIFYYYYYYYHHGARGGVVVKALRYKPVGRGFDSRWCHWNFSLI